MRLTNAQRTFILMLRDKRWTDEIDLLRLSGSSSSTSFQVADLSPLGIAEERPKIGPGGYIVGYQWRLTWIGQAVKMRLRAEGWVLE